MMMDEALQTENFLIHDYLFFLNLILLIIPVDLKKRNVTNAIFL